LPTPAQKAELLRRDGYRCKTPGCPHHLFLEAHHITFFSDEGKTVPENLVILCAACHKNIHEGRMQIEGQAPHHLRFLDATGRDLATQQTLQLAHWLDFFIGWRGDEDDGHVAHAMDESYSRW
ncbi:HNH endonuclease, partial [bacterium]|nr:HNH endonuclease [bacterium]